MVDERERKVAPGPAGAAEACPEHAAPLAPTARPVTSRGGKAWEKAAAAAQQRCSIEQRHCHQRESRAAPGARVWQLSFVFFRWDWYGKAAGESDASISFDRVKQRERVWPSGIGVVGSE